MTDNQADQIVDLLERIYDRLGDMDNRLDTIDDRLINIDTNTSDIADVTIFESIDEKLGTLIDTVWDTESGEFRQPNEIIIDRLDSLKNNTDPLMSIESKIEEIERNTA